jgi:MFS family permease
VYTPIFFSNREDITFNLYYFCLVKSLCIPAAFYYSKRYSNFQEKKFLYVILASSLLFCISFVFCFSLNMSNTGQIATFCTFSCLLSIFCNLLESVTISFMIKIFPRKFNNRIFHLGLIISLTTLFARFSGSLIVTLLSLITLKMIGVGIASIAVMYHIVSLVLSVKYRQQIRVRSISKLFIGKEKDTYK